MRLAYGQSAQKAIGFGEPKPIAAKIYFKTLENLFNH